MHPFEETVSVVGPVVGGVIVLTLFFKFMSWIGGGSKSNPTRIRLKGVLDDTTPSTVYLTNVTVLDNVRLVGFTDASTAKGPFPYELNGMVILEHSDGRRTLIQAKQIRMIEIAAKKS